MLGGGGPSEGERASVGLTIEDEKIAGFEVIADPTRLHSLDLAVLDDQEMFTDDE